MVTEAKLIDAAVTNREPHYEPYGWLHWPEHPWMSYQFRRALGETQEGGGAISECFEAASRMVPGDRLDAVEGLDGVGHPLPDLGLERAPRHGEGDGHRHPATIDLDPFDHVEVDDAALDFGVLDRAEGVEDGVREVPERHGGLVAHGRERGYPGGGEGARDPLVVELGRDHLPALVLVANERGLRHAHVFVVGDRGETAAEAVDRRVLVAG